MQKKWVELFEKVIGRKPSPEEFMAGKACGFDLKQIQSIAGNAPEENLASVEEPVLEPVEEVKNIDPLLAARQAWLQYFEETYGRKAAEQIEAAAKAHQKHFAEAEAALRKHSEKAEANLRTFSERGKDEWVSEIVSGVIENAD